MTENESILSTLQNGIVCATDDITREDLEMMVKCLEELQQYRAIGTVEEIQQKLKNMSLVIDTDRDLLNRYIAIGTIEEFKALKEKNEPKEPDYQGDGCWDGHVIIDTWICPSCGKHYEVDYDDYDYCPNCGQHIDHSGLTEDD